MKFTKLGLDPQIVNALINIGFDTATEVQEKTIPVALENKDIVVRSQTGSGKTFAYILPLIQRLDYSNPNVQVLVVCPTRELSMQVKEEIDKLKGKIAGLKVVPIYGGSDITKQINALAKKPQIVVGTPGRLIDHLTRKKLKLDFLKTVVLDEADEMLNMGFKEDIEKILKKTPHDRQTLMFSATFPKEIMNLTNNYQNNPVRIEVGEDNKSLKNIKQFVVSVNKNEKMDAMLKLFDSLKPKKCIIFTNTKIMAQKLSDFLNVNGHLSQALHGDLRQSTRKKVMNEIKTDIVSILVASDVAARGIDIKDIDYVINFDLPSNVEYFLHRIGRTARAGKNGSAITLVNSKGQLKDLREFEKQTNSVIEQLNLEGVHLTHESPEKPKGRGRSSTSTNDRSYSREGTSNRERYSKDGYSKSSSGRRKESDSTAKSNDSYKKNVKDKDYRQEKTTVDGNKGLSKPTSNGKYNDKQSSSKENFSARKDNKDGKGSVSARKDNRDSKGSVSVRKDNKDSKGSFSARKDNRDSKGSFSPRKDNKDGKGSFSARKANRDGKESFSPRKRDGNQSKNLDNKSGRSYNNQAITDKPFERNEKGTSKKNNNFNSDKFEKETSKSSPTKTNSFKGNKRNKTKTGTKEKSQKSFSDSKPQKTGFFDIFKKKKRK